LRLGSYSYAKEKKKRKRGGGNLLPALTKKGGVQNHQKGGLKEEKETAS